MKHGYVRGPQRREGRPIVCTEGLASHVVLALEDSRSRLGAALVPAAASTRTYPCPRGGAHLSPSPWRRRAGPPRPGVACRITPLQPRLELHQRLARSPLPRYRWTCASRQLLLHSCPL